jgi:4-hydroxy-tetrahydrodipicolinate synthase
MNNGREGVIVEGSVPAVVTPFDENGNLMLDRFEQVVAWHLEQGADGICVAGDNGESWSLTPDERRGLAEAAVRIVGGRVPVLMGASAPMARQTIALAEIAANAGVDALMTGPQSYVLRATAAEIVDRFIAIHKAVPLPIVAYNSPRRTGLSLDVETLGAVCDAVPIIGLKEASRDFFHTTNIIRVHGQRLSVLIGPCPFIIPGLALGARGFISSGPELFGAKAARIRDLAATAPSDETRTLHFALTRIYETLMGTGTWPAALKAALNMIGVPAGLPRDPVQPLTPEDESKLRSVLREIGVLES